MMQYPLEGTIQYTLAWYDYHSCQLDWMHWCLRYRLQAMIFEPTKSSIRALNFLARNDHVQLTYLIKFEHVLEIVDSSGLSMDSESGCCERCSQDSIEAQIRFLLAHVKDR